MYVAVVQGILLKVRLYCNLGIQSKLKSTPLHLFITLGQWTPKCFLLELKEHFFSENFFTVVENFFR